MFNPAHLQGVSTGLVDSMLKISWKAVELEREKLQLEIQKEQSDQTVVCRKVDDGFNFTWNWWNRWHKESEEKNEI